MSRAESYYGQSGHSGRARPTVKFLVSDAWTAVKPQSLERIVADTTSQIRIVRMLAAT